MKTLKLIHNIILIIFISISFSTFSQIKNKQVLAIRSQCYISGIGWDEWDKWQYPLFAINLKIANNGGLVLDVEKGKTQTRLKMYNPTFVRINSGGSYIYEGKADGLFNEGEEKCSYQLNIKEGNLNDLYNGKSDGIFTIHIWITDCEYGESLGIALRVF